MTPKLRVGSATDIGYSRDTQEDDLLIEPPLFAVADGMGGHSAGDVASQTAIKVLGEHMKSESDLVGAMKMANAAVFEEASSKPGLAGMGTTLTALVAKDDSVQIAHVGDSRAYLYRGGELSRLTDDHTVVERLVRQGRLRPEDAHGHPQRSVLERALGLDPDVDIDVEVVQTEAGDRIILCTDGLSGLVPDEEIEGLVARQSDPDKLSKSLVQAALEHGGHDNISVIVIDYPGQAAKAKPGAPSTKTGRSSPKLKTALIALITATLIIIAGLFMARSAIKDSWYVGESDGRVAIFNGVPGEVVGINLSELDTATDVDVASLPPIYEQRLRSGIKVDDRPEALRTIENLRLLAQQPTPPGAGP